MRGLRRAVLWLLTAGLTFYLVLVGVLFFAQRSLVFPAPTEQAALPQGFERVALHTADGLTLAAAYRPAHEGRPTLVFFHGNADDWQGAASATAGLVAQGYGALLPDYRGYSGNPGSPDEQGLYEDGRAALGWLEAQGIPSARLVIIGNSIGSGVAVQMAIEQEPAALVLVSPLASVPLAVSDKLPFLPASLLVRDRFDNLAKIGRIEAPVLLLHGTADAVIPSSHSQRLAEANPGARLVLAEGSGHELAYRPAAQAVEREWLETTLAAKSDD
jgi:fermentation-respiration switch protein FrsA (DUF1100 family)